MRLNWLAFAFVLLLFLCSVSAAEDLFYNGSLHVELNKPEFAPGESIEAKITLLNLESIPIAEAYAVVELVHGGQYYYPSQSSDADNVFVEEKISGLNLAPNSSVTVPFSYKLPADLQPGSYRMDVYAKTNKTHIVGAPHIFAAPSSVNFSVAGKGGQFPGALFVRTKTEFHNFTGPIGPGISPGESIQNNVFVKNISSQDLSNLTLAVGLCEWDDTSCASFDSSATEKIALLKAGEEKAISVQLAAPKMPDAYAIRLELRDADGRLLSLYRNRSIVYGPTAKIHKLSISDYSFKKGDSGRIDLLVGPSPDHYNEPTFTDFTLKAWIENIRDRNVVVFTEQLQIASIASATAELKSETFSFTALADLDLFKVCALIEKDGVQHEFYCYVVDASKFPAKVQKSEIAVKWDYDYDKRKLNLFFSNEVEAVKEISASFMLMDFAANDLVANKMLEGKSPLNDYIAVEPGNFVLILNNFATGKQQRIDINLKETAQAASLKTCAEQGGTMCSANQICENSTASAESGLCCLTACKGRVSTSPLALPWEQFYSIVFWIAIILVILIIGYVVHDRVLGKSRNEKIFSGERIENDIE